MNKDDKIWITCEGRRVEGRVILISPNKVSLMIGFDAMLTGHLGVMPILLHEDGVYRSIFDGVVVEIEPVTHG